MSSYSSTNKRTPFSMYRALRALLELRFGTRSLSEAAWQDLQPDDITLLRSHSFFAPISCSMRLVSGFMKKESWGIRRAVMP